MTAPEDNALPLLFGRFDAAVLDQEGLVRRRQVLWIRPVAGLGAWRDLDDLDDLPDPGPRADADAEPRAGAPTLRVELVRKGAQASVLVHDNGPGIPMAEGRGPDFEQIFEAFVTSKTHGTGLGLPMVQQVALDHGGSVRLVETGPTGTTFAFSLPACDPPGPSVSSANSA